MSLLSAEERFFVESDACWHGSQQGEYRVLRLSEIFVRRGGDAIMVVFMRRHNADPLRERLGRLFEHVIYLCDPMPMGETASS